MEIIKSLKITSECIIPKITIKGTYNNPLFCAIDIANILNIGDEELNEVIKGYTKSQITIQENTVFFTESGLYNFIGTVRYKSTEYFRNWNSHIMKNLRENGHYKMQKRNDDYIDIERAWLKYKDNFDRHNALMRYSANKRVVYICKLKMINDGKYLIKIGSTNDIVMEYDKIINEGNMDINPIFHYAVEAVENNDFEVVLHENPFIKELKCGNDKNENYIVTLDELGVIVDIANYNRYYFKEADYESIFQNKLGKNETKPQKNANHIKDIIAKNRSYYKEIVLNNPDYFIDCDMRFYYN